MHSNHTDIPQSLHHDTVESLSARDLPSITSHLSADELETIRTIIETHPSDAPAVAMSNIISALWEDNSICATTHDSHTLHLTRCPPSRRPLVLSIAQRCYGAQYGVYIRNDVSPTKLHWMKRTNCS